MKINKSKAIKAEDYEDYIISSKTDKNGIITYVSKAFEELSGYSKEELIGKPHSIVRHPDMSKETFYDLWKTIQSGKVWWGNIKNRKKDGTSYWVKAMVKPNKEKSGEIVGFTAIRQDITKEIEVSNLDLYSLKENFFSGIYEYIGILEIRGLSKLGATFPLTQLMTIKERIIEKLKTCNDKNIRIFKAIGDKFIFLTKYKTDKENEKALEKLITKLNESRLGLITESQDIDYCCGIAKITDYSSLSATINAEIALSIAKKSKVHNYFVYNESNEDVMDMVSSLEWKEKTKFLVSEKEIYPFYQPIMDIKTGEIKKYEVLARGKLNNTVISPFFFISHAEELGLIMDITRIIISKSFKYFKDNEIEFSINITENDLKDETFIDFISEEMVEHKINPNRVILEILENITFSKDSEIVMNRIITLQQMGFKMAIDDFGSDNSNFSRLLNIHIDFIKFDAIFIKNINKNERNKILVQSMVSMAKVLNIKTVAEFVENEEILEIVKECGIDYAQGYYIGKPEENIL